MTQTFRISWLTGKVTPELLTSLLQRYARETMRPEGYPVVTEITDQEKPGGYHIVMTPSRPMSAERLNETAAKGFHLLGVVRGRDTTVEHYRELFYHYFGRDG